MGPDLDGDIHRSRPFPYGPAPARPALITTHPIPRPIRVASAALEGREGSPPASWSLTYADPARLRRGGPATVGQSPAAAWRSVAVVAGPLRGSLLRGRRALVAETALPPGWNHWSLISSIWPRSIPSPSARGPTARTPRTGRAVKPAEPVVGVLTSEGRPVYGGLPRFTFRPSLLTRSQDVSLADARGTLMSRVSVTNSGGPKSLWVCSSQPLLGVHGSCVRGPWGRSAAKTLFIAEGLNLRCEPSWRRLASNGLVPEPRRDIDRPGNGSSRETVG